MPAAPGPPCPLPVPEKRALTKSFRCLAHTRPSPPLLPGPQITRTEGLAFTKEHRGYAYGTHTHTSMGS